MTNLENLQKVCTQVRRDIIRMVYFAQSGHPGGSLGCTEFLTALYFHIMQHDRAFHMAGHHEDMFFLSNGHISPLWYSVLSRSGYFPVDELGTFRKIHSRLQGHPATHEGLPGVRIASGSLGQGLSVAIGAALAKKLDQDPRLVYVLTGDGELQEGQAWEAAMFAAHHHVDNIIATVDWNGQQIDGTNDNVISLGDLHAKWSAFGWHVFEMNGNQLSEVLSTMDQAKQQTGNGKPIVILMHTIMGRGVDFMEGDHNWHGIPPSQEQARKALVQLEETIGDFPYPETI